MIWSLIFCAWIGFGSGGSSGNGYPTPYRLDSVGIALTNTGSIYCTGLINGTTLYSFYGAGPQLKIYDITNPITPAQTASKSFYEHSIYVFNPAVIYGTTMFGLAGAKIAGSYSLTGNMIDTCWASGGSYYSQNCAVNSQGTVFYLSASYQNRGAMYSFDISNPSSIAFLDSFDYGASWPHAMATDSTGNYLYVAHHVWGVMVLDVSNPSAITYVSDAYHGFDQDAKFCHAILRNRHYLYTYAGASGGSGYGDCFKVYDISTPSTPVRIARIGTTATTGEMAVMRMVGNYIFIGTTTGKQLMTVDVSIPTRPELLETKTFSGTGWVCPVGLCSDSSTFYITNGNTLMRYNLQR